MVKEAISITMEGERISALEKQVAELQAQNEKLAEIITATGKSAEANAKQIDAMQSDLAQATDVPALDMPEEYRDWAHMVSRKIGVEAPRKINVG